MVAKQCIRCKESKSVEDFRAVKVKGREFKRDGTRYRKSFCKLCEYELKRTVYPSGIYTRVATNVNRRGSVKVSASDIRSLGLPETTICYLCGESITSRDDAELDHITPRSQGGDNYIENLAWTHKLCNRIKHNLTVPELISQLEKMLQHLNG